MQQGPARRLTRGRDRMIGGVAAGFAEYFDFDPSIVRVAFVLAGVFAPPVTVVTYLIFLWLMPRPMERSAERALPAGAPPGSRPIAIVLLVIGALLLLGPMSPGMWFWGMPHFWSGGWFWPARLLLPALVILAGLFLLTRRRPE